MKLIKTTVAALIIVATSAFTIQSATASSVLQQPIDVLAKTSELVFEGTVVGIRSEAINKRIYTFVTFDVSDIVKGQYDQTSIELRYLGGTANGTTMSVGDMTIPSYGEHGVYFVEDLNGNNVHPLRGWGQGHFLVKQNGGNQSIFNSQGKAVTAISTGKTANITSAAKINNNTAAGVQISDNSKQVMNLNSFKDSIRGL